MFSAEEKNFIKSLGINTDFENLIDDILIEIEEKVSDVLQIKGFGENCNITKIGKLCEEILDKLSEFDSENEISNTINLRDYNNKKIKITDVNGHIFMGWVTDYIAPAEKYTDDLNSTFESIIIHQNCDIEISKNKIRSICLLDENGQEENNENFDKTRTCPSCYGNLLYNADTQYHVCECCNFAISEKSLLDGYIYWFCDKCKCFMNVQEGFNTKSGVWNCKRCGFENDVSEKNIKD